MIEVPVAQDDVADAPRIDTDLPDISDDVIDVRFLGRVEQDVPVGRRQQPDRDVAGSDVIEVVEHLEGLNLLKLHVVGASDSIRFTQRLRRGLAEYGCAEIAARENDKGTGGRERGNAYRIFHRPSLTSNATSTRRCRHHLPSRRCSWIPVMPAAFSFRPAERMFSTSRSPSWRESSQIS